MLMRGYRLRGAWVIAMAGLGLLGLGGCGRPSGPSPDSGEERFAVIVDRLRTEAQRKSVEGTTITVALPVSGADGRRIITARRVRDGATTVYTLEFAPGSDAWVCCEAVAEETGPGGERSTNTLRARATEFDQLVRWLGW